MVVRVRVRVRKLKISMKKYDQLMVIEVMKLTITLLADRQE